MTHKEKIAEIRASYRDDGHDPSDVWPLKLPHAGLAAHAPEAARHMTNLHALWWEAHKEGKDHRTLRHRIERWSPDDKLGWYWQQSILSELAFNDELRAAKVAGVAYRPAAHQSLWAQASDGTPEQAAMQLLGITRLQPWRATMAGVPYESTALLDHQEWFCANIDRWMADHDAAPTGQPLSALLKRRPAMLAHRLSDMIWDSIFPPEGGAAADLSLYLRLQPLVEKLATLAWERAGDLGEVFYLHVGEVADTWAQVTGTPLAAPTTVRVIHVGQRPGWAAQRTGSR